MMKKSPARTATVLALLATLAPGLATAQSTALTQDQFQKLVGDSPLTLDQAVKVALAANPNVRQALANYRKATGAFQEVRAAFLPQISLSARGTEFDKANVFDFATVTGGPSLPLTIANRWNPELMAALSMQIDISGAIRSASDQAEFMALASRIDIDRVRNDLVLQVKSQYYQALRLHGRREIAQESLKAVQERLRNAKSQESVGNAAKFDVVSAERDLAAAQQEVVASQVAEANALAGLKNTLGIDQTVPLALAIQAPEPAETTTPEPGDSDPGTVVQDSLDYGPEYANLLQNAAKLRPEVLEAQAMLEARKHGFRYAERSLKPSLTAGISYSHQPNNGAFTLENSTLASLTLNVPVFDGGLAQSRKNQAQADVESAQSNLTTALEYVKLNVQASLASLLEAKSRLALAEAGLKQAEEANRLAKVRYEVGVTQTSVVSPQLELRSAQVALTEAKTNRLKALYDLALAQAALDHAVGKFAPVTQTQTQTEQDKS